MKSVEKKTFSSADEVTDKFKNALIEAVNVRNQRVHKLTLKPGWKWSTDVKPHLETETCQATHLGVITKGTICCKHDDGSEITYTAGDAYAIAPGHDAWVVGDEDATAYEFAGMWA
jgi:quercetin dioxygenase-like cupin family protein